MLSEKSVSTESMRLTRSSDERPQARRSSSVPTGRAIARFSMTLRTSSATRSVNSASEKSGTVNTLQTRRSSYAAKNSAPEYLQMNCFQLVTFMRKNRDNCAHYPPKSQNFALPLTLPKPQKPTGNRGAHERIHHHSNGSIARRRNLTRAGARVAGYEWPSLYQHRKPGVAR